MHDKWSGAELDSLLGKASLTRRDMLVTSLAVGFAAATLPVRADTVISTPADGLTAGEVKIGHRGEWYDCSKAVNELGMPRTPLPETVRKAITWFRENGYLPQVKGEAN